MANVKSGFQFKMYRLLSTIVIILVVEKLQHSTVASYKWISLQPGDQIPKTAVILDSKQNSYVGRAWHFNVLLPAEVFNTRKVLVTSCSKVFSKQQFEILVNDATGSCNWRDFKSIKDIPETVVRVGTASNGEPSYLGRTYVTTGYWYAASIYFTTNRVEIWPQQNGTTSYLNCQFNNTWIDTIATRLPKKSVSGGQNHDGKEIFVAQLLNGCDIISGQVIPELGYATAEYEGRVINATYCQVLVENGDKYRWISTENGNIPDYAVVSARRQNTGEVMYVGRMNKTLVSILHVDALTNRWSYDILVKNEG